VPLIEARAADIDVGDLRLVFVPSDTAAKLGVRGGYRLRIKVGSYVTTAAAVVDSSLEGGAVYIPKRLYEELGAPKAVDVDLAGIPRSVDYIKKKLSGGKLSYDEIREIISDVVNGVLGEAEMAAFISAQVSVGMDVDEIVSLTRAMVETGEVIRFDEPAYDMHSIGGVPGNSKVAIVAVPIVASAGILIPKTSSRAITSPAGTADTMEVFAPVTFKPEEVVELAKKVRGFIIWGGALNLAPADDILIRVEHKLKLDPVPQMVASILSKKLSMSIRGLVIDIPAGRGAKVETVEEARNLASLFVQVGQKLGLNLRCAISYGGQPVGRAVGPALEAREALEVLLGGGPMSVREKAVSLAGMVLEIAGAAPTGAGRKVALEILNSGKAYQTFRRIVEAMGGNPDVKPDDISVGPYKAEIRAPVDGYITNVYNKAITEIAIAAGAPHDKGAGVKLHVKRGDRVKEGDVLLEVFSGSESRLDEALKVAQRSRPVTIEGMILEVYPEYV